MAALLDISASIPEATIRDFFRACNRFRNELGNSQAVAVRRGTIALIRGLRARTIRAKRQAPLKDVTRYDGPGPHYITPKGKGQKSQRRWAIKRRGGADAKTYVKAADTRSDARRRFAKYTRWGLARKSWGWFMQALFSRNNPESGNPLAKVDSRMVEGNIREVVTGTNPRVEVLIVNKLDYIRSALPDSALSEAMAAATRYIDGQLNRGLAEARKELA